ncbi:DoxX family protein [Haloarcula sebkhae]|uniref:MauE/DoxX family redox-associated membrane protein n=2 Tax=Haloarcula sebkhae TaxID=932660 RepID=A0ACC6VRE4_9EURY|nr:MauE/DoxX family redox-associated membrane protein [Haloarcula sebkhae]GGK77389.1 membrane protein [Haloarcula sebkhae]
MRVGLRQLKRPLCYVMALLYVAAGGLHFVVPDLYVQIVPPVLPAPLALVYLSGVAEIAVGLGLLVPRTRSYAAWATIALLLAIFPANVYMAVSMVTIEGTGGGDPSALARWARLPLQGVLILWAYWYTD